MSPELIEAFQRLGQTHQEPTRIGLELTSGRPRSDAELLRIYHDPQAPLSALSTDELIRLERLTHPNQAGRLGPPGPTTSPIVPNPDRPWPGLDPDPRGGTLWFRTQQDATDFARREQQPRDDATLLKFFYSPTADLSSLTTEELTRLLALTDPIRSVGPAPLVPIIPPNPERPYLARDPNPMIENLWFERPEDVEWFYRSIGVDPFQLRGVYRGIQTPLPKAWTLPPWPR